MDPLLSVRGLRCGYGPCEVLAGVDLDVRPGELVGLLGPNGSGKTTLLRAVTGVASPAAGTVLVGGAPAARLSARDLARRAAVVPQDTAAAFPFTVAEVVEMGRYAHRGPFDGPTAADAAAVRSALARAGAAGLAGRDVDALSAGERQRVLLARALAQDTPLLLVDEPTAHLDIRHQVGMLELLRDLATGRASEGEASSPPGAGNGERGPRPARAVLAVLHDLNLASRYCTRIALLKDGRIAADGLPEEVLTPARIQDVFRAEVEVLRVDGETHIVVGRSLRPVPEPLTTA
jgi:iron complex transport system ATP-binding protein